ncbi:MAG TPA: TIGR03619 family F420-dependent LLM class oxidoreductase [Streptosporangiaceae bacterium]|jgi:probable F420-dependent oxidoreductase
MDFGLALPTTGTSTSPEVIVDVAVAAERIGLASVWTFERLLRPTQPLSFGEGEPFIVPEYYASVYEPIETLAYVAAGTERIRLGTSVIDSLFHPPVALARRFATLDRLSGGRVVAGVGQGWMPQEFAVAGVPMKRKGAGFQEHIEAMRACWGPDPVKYDGRFYQIPESEISPKPVQAGGPPVIVGAAAVPSAERSGRMGVGLNPIAGNPVFATLDALGDYIQTFRRAAEEAGHDPNVLPVVVRVNGTITEQPLDEREPLTGSVDQVADDLPKLEPFGVTEVLWAMSSPPDEQITAMERLLAATGTATS